MTNNELYCKMLEKLIQAHDPATATGDEVSLHQGLVALKEMFDTDPATPGRFSAMCTFISFLVCAVPEFADQMSKQITILDRQMSGLRAQNAQLTQIPTDPRMH